MRYLAVLLLAVVMTVGGAVGFVRGDADQPQVAPAPGTSSTAVVPAGSAEGLTGVIESLQDRLRRLPADPDVREDLHSVRKVVTKAHHVRLDARRDDGGHADRFWALALAHHAADEEPSRLPVAVARKPVGW